VRVDNGNIVTPGCPACRKTLYTTSNFIDHINNDVLPPLLDRLSKSENAEPPDEDSIDRLLGGPGAENTTQVGGAGRDLGGDRSVFEDGMADVTGWTRYG
jgi:hypothetical protein